MKNFFIRPIIGWIFLLQYTQEVNNMAFNYYPQPYPYTQQDSMQRLQRMRDEITEQLTRMQQQPMPQIQQTFITPQASTPSEIPARWVDSYEDVKNSMVYVSTIFMDKNKSKFYIKDETGSIKSFEFMEVEELDEKDIKIRELENRLKELEGGMAYVKSVNEPNGNESRQSAATDVVTEVTTS